MEKSSEVGISYVHETHPYGYFHEEEPFPDRQEGNLPPESHNPRRSGEKASQKISHACQIVASKRNIK